MASELEYLLGDEKARLQIGEHGLQTIRKHHTCAHRAEQLISICEEIAA
jgi:spore maturation protein CgeB